MNPLRTFNTELEAVLLILVIIGLGLWVTSR